METLHDCDVITITITGHRYTVEVSPPNDSGIRCLTIYRDDVWSTDGIWRDAQIEDAPGDLGEDVYAALDYAIATALNHDCTSA